MSLQYFSPPSPYTCGQATLIKNNVFILKYILIMTIFQSLSKGQIVNYSNRVGNFLITWLNFKIVSFSKICVVLSVESSRFFK